MAVAHPYRALARAVEAGLLPSAVLTEEVTLRAHYGVLHEPPCWVVPFDERAAVQAAPALTLTVLALAEEKVCRCAAHPLSALLDQASMLLEHHAVARRAEGTDPSEASPGALEKRRRELSDSLMRLEPLSAPELGEARDALEQRLERATRRLERVLRDPGQQVLQLERARASLTRGRAIELDGSPVLVGLEDSPTRLPKALVEFVGPFALRTGPASVVLRLPRYGYDFLQRELVRTNQGQSFVVAHPADDEERVLETAAALWDPFSDGPCADLAAALSTARALEA